MPWKLVLACLLAGIAAALPAWPGLALSLEELNGPLPGMRPVPADVVSWHTLGKASLVPARENGAERIVTLAPPEVEALDGQEVKLMGFMLPLDDEAPMRRFLLVEYPLLCAFCLAGSAEPSRIVEVQSAKGIEHREEQVILRGRLEVVHGENHFVYRLHAAELAE